MKCPCCGCTTFFYLQAKRSVVVLDLNRVNRKTQIRGRWTCDGCGATMYADKQAKLVAALDAVKEGAPS